jgi:hypothetical protein
VQRVIDLIQAGNPEIVIWAQIVVPPGRKPSPDTWLAYHNQIADLVDGTYVGIYTWSLADEQPLIETLQAIFTSVCGKE